MNSNSRSDSLRHPQRVPRPWRLPDWIAFIALALGLFGALSIGGAVYAQDVPQATLELFKQASVTQVAPGGTIDYSITILNNSRVDALNVTMLDFIPTGTTFIPGSETASEPTVAYDSGDNKIKWNGSIGAGKSVTVKFSVKVNEKIECAAEIRNRAALVDANGKVLLEAFAIVKINCPGQPILDIRKEASVSSVAPNGEIGYLITVSNGGTGPATGVIVHDPIPAGATFIAGSEASTDPTLSFNAGANRIEWTGNIPVGGSVSIKFRVRVNEQLPCDGVIYNKAQILSPTGAPGPFAEIRTLVECPRPLLQMRKTAIPTATLPGGEVEWVIVVANSGDGPANNVMVVDPIPAGTAYIPGSVAPAPPGTYNAGLNRVEWLVNIAPHSTVTLKFKVKVSPEFPCDKPIGNRAAMLNANNVEMLVAEASVWVGCPNQPIVTIAKRANVEVVMPGGMIEYKILIQNVGSAPAMGVTMIDPIPAGATFVAGSETATAGTVAYDSGANHIKWSGDIPVGGSVVVTFKVQAGEKECGIIIENRATIVREAVNESPFAIARVKVDCGAPHLEVRKAADVTQTVAGGQIAYTIKIANVGTAPATGVTMIDPIPAGTTFVVGSESATFGSIGYDAGNNWVKWGGDIPAGGAVVITFKVTVDLDAPCQARILNHAFVYFGDLKLVAEAVTIVICKPEERFPDFGDAPDSDSNHFGMKNTAYAAGPVFGRFPSVWDNTPVAEPSGPHHQKANEYWLGERVTREKDADLLPDDDGVTNILNNGAADTADNDKADDGWRNLDAPFLDCRETVLRVRISRALIPPPVERLYLNVWFDGNRDGDWDDVGACPQIGAKSFEWIVQNWWIDPLTIPAGGFIEVPVPTVLVHNAKPDADAWLRFTLSEQRATPNPGTGLPDGRGPAFPNALRLGETEDYYRKGVTQGQPGEIKIEKTVNPAGAVAVGDVLSYRVVVKHVGGTAVASTVMSDVLPAGVALVAGPFVSELAPNAAPLVAGYNPGGGPSGVVGWAGTLSPNAAVQIEFRVRVRECVTVLRNVAVALTPNGQKVEAKTENTVNCQPTDPAITLKKAVFVQNSNQEAVDAPILPGDTAIYLLTLSATDGLSHTVHISDEMPAGLVAVAVSASSGLANIVNSGHTVVWDGALTPSNSPVSIKILVRQEQQLACDKELVNVAKWMAEGATGESNRVLLRVACRDLGDAPDSTNHFGAAMNAYAGVPAKYPTVFDVAAPERGPRHEMPRPFHLGKGVSAEVEADQGFDVDGFNNIDPGADKANQDKADDGLLLSTVALRHCQISTMRVVVSIDPVALGLLPNRTGYLNVWVDSDRNGDWAGKFECPQSATGAPATALEHIVIDMPINAATLGAGVHTLNVNTTVPVFWRDEIAQKPAWLRVTLSERQSNKPLGTYGDGRGYDEPFRLGETEDYLLVQQHADGSADPVVTKRGEIWPDFNPETQQRRWVVGWIANYANLGSAPANNVHLVDTFDAPQTLLAEHSIPLVPHTQSANTLDYNVGTLNVGATGLVIIRTSVPFSTAPGTVLRNTVTVNSGNDGNTLNNTSVATVTVPLLPPLITSPLAGSTCTTTIEVRGHAQANVTVDLYVDEDAPISLTANASGEWSATLNLIPGNHDLYAKARLGSQESDPSPTVTVIVDPTLFWDPISLRFQDDMGHQIIPSGRLDEGGWTIFLRPGHTYTVSLRVCCDDPNAQVTMQIGSISINLTDDDGDHIFTGTFTVPEGGRFSGVVRICVTCHLIRRCSDGEVTIDPEGTVYDLLSKNPIAGAQVACMQASVSMASTSGGDGQQSFSLWPAADFQQVNPQNVGADGYFSFFTPQGAYRLNVTKPGYQAYESIDLVVVDAPVHHDVPLTPIINKAADQQIAITDSGFEPSVVTVAPGAVVEWINAGNSAHSSTSVNATQAAALNASVNWDSGLLQTGESYKMELKTAGTYTYSDSANPDATATIIVAEAPVSQQQMIFLPAMAR